MQGAKDLWNGHLSKKFVYKVKKVFKDFFLSLKCLVNNTVIVKDETNQGNFAWQKYLIAFNQDPM